MTGPVKSLRSISDLVAAELVAPSDAPTLEAVASRYAVTLTPEMVALIERGDPHDPIARQFVPSGRELEITTDERADPIGDRVHEKVPGLIHRYRDRVLLKLAHACPVYCRFCFRREVVGPGGEPPLHGPALDAALAYIAADPHIWEVILTGGDPLMLSARRIGEITARLSSIPHVRVLRWHSRVPIVDPGRIDAELVAALGSSSRIVHVGIHANHPRELTDAARAAILRLRAAGIILVSQTVLLRGVNDDAATLEALFRAFVGT